MTAETATDTTGTSASAKATAENGETHTQVALITGAAKGIGAAIAKRLAHDGFNVVINYHSDGSAEAAECAAEAIHTECGVETLAVQCDVSDYVAVKEMAALIKERFGRIDVLVNNAGITKDGLLMRMSEEQFDDVIRTNLAGTFNCMRHIAPIMVKQRSGRIINISSVVGVYGNAGQINYAASKAGIIGMTKTAAKELGSRNITVNAVAPGFIETDMTAALGEKASEALTGRIALGRLGQTEDVANAVSFFADSRTSYVTGQILSVDGGISI